MTCDEIALITAASQPFGPTAISHPSQLSIRIYFIEKALMMIAGIVCRRYVPLLWLNDVVAVAMAIH